MPWGKQSCKQCIVAGEQLDVEIDIENISDDDSDIEGTRIPRRTSKTGHI